VSKKSSRRVHHFRIGRRVDPIGSYDPRWDHPAELGNGGEATNQTVTRQTVAKLEPLDLGRRETVSMEISRRLLAYLLAGDIKPGERIPSERRLAEALGVGRSVVREALKSLTLLGLIDVRQGDGTYLRGTESDLLPQSIEWGLMLGQKRTLDLVEARRHLEEVLAGLAATRRTDEDLAALHDLLQAMRDSSGDPDAFVAADIAFHLRVTQAAGNETLGSVISGIRSLLQVWISRVMHSAGSYAPSVAEHEAILASLEAGDVDGSRAAMHAHMDGAYRRLEATLGHDGGEIPLHL
jgi:GntR family transcriptional regulator, transcriptional repressor for pyruvate dehydrogenase complex